MVIICALLLPGISTAGAGARLDLSDFKGLAEKAVESVDITLDPSLLAIAGRFLDGGDPQDAATKEVIKGLQGIYVRSFSFDADGAYQDSDLEAIRRQLAAPGWSRLVQTRSRTAHTAVDIFVMKASDKAVGLALIASEPREFTIVNIVGAIDLDKLRRLEGQFGIPKIDAASVAK
jgi:hypothetical protein